jgi:hypothetical protein
MMLPYDARVFIAAILAVSTPATAADYSLPPPAQDYSRDLAICRGKAALADPAKPDCLCSDFPSCELLAARLDENKREIIWNCMTKLGWLPNAIP